MARIGIETPGDLPDSRGHALKNLELAQIILQECASWGVREIVLCAGARNAPFVSTLKGDAPFKVYSFFEERSAAFFALGRMQATGKPVAVITTSGTAAAELLPACIEADYQRLPLVLITADRPKRYRGTGAPQTIVQTGIFSHYVERAWDVEGEFFEADGEFTGRRPVHFNVCFDEPLIDGIAGDWQQAPAPEIRKPEPPKLNFLGMRKPLILLGGLTSREAEQILPKLKSYGRPIYAEAPSKLRGHPELKTLTVKAGGRSLRNIQYDGIIRIGNIPTLRLWRDLENNQVPILNFSSAPFPGMPRVKEVFPLESLADFKFESWSEKEREEDFRLREKCENLLKEFPLGEPAMVHWLSRKIPRSARLFLGNSLPIREWDDFADHDEGAFDVFANRGTNGIDGLVSTFTGCAGEDRDNWALIGDLSALYDLSGPWALRERPLKSWNLAVINNSGGQIFNRIFRDPKFLNEHQLRLDGWAKMWNLDYIKIDSPTQKLSAGKQVVEIIPSAEQTEAFWNAWEKS